LEYVHTSAVYGVPSITAIIYSTFILPCRASSRKWNKWLYIHPCWGWSKSAKNCGM